MKKLLLFFGIIFLLTDCKKDDSPAFAIEPILGKWNMVELEGYVMNVKQWITVVDSSGINILPSGVILVQTGLVPCCPAESLTINGTSFKITKNTDLKLFDPYCMTVNCVSCPNLIIEQSGNEMMITRCGGNREKYKRE